MGERGWGEGAEGKNEFAPDFEKSEDSRLHVGRQPHGQFFEYIPPEVAKIKRVDGAGQKAIFEVRGGGNDTKSRAGSRHKCFPSGPKKLYTSPTKKDTYGMLGTNIGAFGAGDNQLGWRARTTRLSACTARRERGPNTT